MIWLNNLVNSIDRVKVIHENKYAIKFSSNPYEVIDAVSNHVSYKLLIKCANAKANVYIQESFAGNNTEDISLYEWIKIDVSRRHKVK